MNSIRRDLDRMKGFKSTGLSMIPRYTICKAPGCYQKLSTLSESYIVGGWCTACRDCIPSHIPLEQHGRYLDKIIERMEMQHEREEKESKHQHCEQESKSEGITEVRRYKYIKHHWNKMWQRRTNRIT